MPSEPSFARGASAAAFPRRLSVLAALGCLVLCIRGAAADPPTETAAERILAVVDGMPVLLSEARLIARLKGLDAEGAREALIDELLMAREATRLPQATVEPEEVHKIVNALSEAHPGIAEQAGVQGLTRLATRQAVILRYVEFRFRPQIRITDEDVLREWAALGEAGPMPPDPHEQLRVELERREIDARVEAWVSELRRKARVRYNRSPAP